MRRVLKGLRQLVMRIRRIPRRFRRDARKVSQVAAGFDRIHYACGANVREGWLNVDGFEDFAPTPAASSIYSVDLAGRHPFPDGHWRYGYAEDFLEHLDQADSLVFLAEAYRTFRPAGVLRLSFPSLEGVLAKHYRRSDYEGARAGMKEAYTDWEHLHFYSFEELRLVSDHLGWSGIREVAFGESEHEPLRGIDTRVEQIELNLIVELTR